MIESKINMKIYYTNNSNWRENIPSDWREDYPSDWREDYPKEEHKCLHDGCSQCGGSGKRKDGLGFCFHMISCPCPKCTPR